MQEIFKAYRQVCGGLSSEEVETMKQEIKDLFAEITALQTDQPHPS